MAPDNPIPCGGLENSGEGCGEYFSRMSSSQRLCGRCKKLSDQNLSQADIEKILALPQCLSCGVCGQSIKNPCGTCRRHANEENGTVNALRTAAADERYLRAQNSFGKRPPVPRFNEQPTQAPIIGATTPLAEIETSKATSNKGNWSVIYNVRRGKGAVDKQLGSGVEVFSGDTPMPSVLEELIKLVNHAWTREEGNSLDLSLSECQLRFYGNFVFAKEAETLSIKDFYNFYLNRPDKNLLFPPVKSKQAKGTFLQLEVFINDVAYKRRLNQQLGIASLVSNTNTVRSKRRSNDNLHSSAAAELSSTVKRRRSGTVLVSSFQSQVMTQPITQSIVQTITITFRTITCGVDAISGASRLEETRTTRKGKLDRKELQVSSADQGRSKDVYRLTISDLDEIYVAKRFKDSIAVDSQNGADRNLNLLLHELVRVKRLKEFQILFSAYARSKAVEIADFDVTDTFIICLEESWDHDISIGSTFIVEPLRATTATTKFSGTFGVNEKTDKMSVTISAFAHYVAEHTACKLVFVDLQGSMDYKPGQYQKMILFDPMTHTPHEGSSGLGDHGVAGIKDFIETHTCSIPCKRLKLADKEVLSDTLQSIIDDIKEAKETGEEAHLPEQIVVEMAPEPNKPTLAMVSDVNKMDKKKEKEEVVGPDDDSEIVPPPPPLIVVTPPLTGSSSLVPFQAPTAAELQNLLAVLDSMKQHTA